MLGSREQFEKDVYYVAATGELSAAKKFIKTWSHLLAPKRIRVAHEARRCKEITAKGNQCNREAMYCSTHSSAKQKKGIVTPNYIRSGERL